MSKLTFLVGSGDGLDSVVAQCAEYLDDGSFIGSNSGNGVMQLLRIKLGERGH